MDEKKVFFKIYNEADTILMNLELAAERLKYHSLTTFEDMEETRKQENGIYKAYRFDSFAICSGISGDYAIKIDQLANELREKMNELWKWHKETEAQE